MSAQLCKCGKTSFDPTLKMSECKVCELYLNKAVLENGACRHGDSGPALLLCLPAHCAAFAVGNPSDVACGELDSYLISLGFTFFIWTAGSIGCFLKITEVPRTSKSDNTALLQGAIRDDFLAG